MKKLSENSFSSESSILEKAMSNFKTELTYFLRKHYHWDKHEAQTIYHDACLLVLQQLKKGSIKEINKPYLLKICKNLGANEYRKNLKQKKRFLLYWTETSKTYLDSIYTNYGINVFEPEEYLEIHAIKALRAFSMLNEKCQQIIHLKYVNNQSHEAIAKESSHVNTVNSSKTTLNRCLKYWRNLNKKIA